MSLLGEEMLLGVLCMGSRRREERRRRQALG